MHHLSARTLFITKPRVALKSLDALIPNVQAYQHISWVYAFRFLRISFSLQLGTSHQDLSAALQNLHEVSEIAQIYGDTAISVFCATMESLVHLRSMNAGCIEETQRAIAAARSFQFHPSAKTLSQIWALLDCIDLVCSLLQCNPDTAAAKAKAMSSQIDDIDKAPSSADDGLLLIPLQTSPSPLTENTTGIFKLIDGQDNLVFSWLHRRDLYVLCFLLSSIATQAKNQADTRAVTYLRQGLKILKGSSILL